MNRERLHVEALRVDFAGVTVVSDVVLPTLEPGSITVVVGPNGAGKSSLLRGMSGLHRASGRVMLGSSNLLAMTPRERGRRMTFMPQFVPESAATTLLESLLDALRVGLDLSPGQRMSRATATLHRLGILPLAMTSLNRLSGGQRQLGSLAQALVREPDVLLLDEPTSALDLNFQHRVMEIVTSVAEESGMIVMAVVHDVNLAFRWGHNVVVLKDGVVLAAGDPDSALTDDVIRKAYAVDSSRLVTAGGLTQIVVEGRTGADRA